MKSKIKNYLSEPQNEVMKPKCERLKTARISWFKVMYGLQCATKIVCLHLALSEPCSVTAALCMPSFTLIIKVN